MSYNWSKNKDLTKNLIIYILKEVKMSTEKTSSDIMRLFEEQDLVLKP